MAGATGRGDGGEHSAYSSMPFTRPDLLYCKSRLQQALALQGHGDKPLTSSWAPPKSEALFFGRTYKRNQEESILDFVYFRLVSKVEVDFLRDNTNSLQLLRGFAWTSKATQ